MIIDTELGALEPTIDRDSRPFWDALAQGAFHLPWCPTGGHFFFPPTAQCLKCGAQSVEFRDAPKGGAVYAWIEVQRSLHPAFDADVPYTVVAVDLDCGARIFGRLLDASSSGLRAGDPVEFCAYRAQGFVLPGFRLTAGGQANGP
jgi:uncharacterized OB-fold protein